MHVGRHYRYSHFYWVPRWTFWPKFAPSEIGWRTLATTASPWDRFNGPGYVNFPFQSVDSAAGEITWRFVSPSDGAVTEWVLSSPVVAGVVKAQYTARMSLTTGEVSTFQYTAAVTGSNSPTGRAPPLVSVGPVVAPFNPHDPVVDVWARAWGGSNYYTYPYLPW
jgi:hypothetical protein